MSDPYFACVFTGFLPVMENSGQMAFAEIYLSQEEHCVSKRTTLPHEFKKERFLLESVQWRSDPNRITCSVVPTSGTGFLFTFMLYSLCQKKNHFLSPYFKQAYISRYQSREFKYAKCCAYFPTTIHVI